MLGRHFEHVVELCKELSDALLLVFDAHALDGELHDIDSGEAEVTAPHRRLRPEAVLEHTGAAAHRGHLMQIALRVIGTPFRVLVKRGVEIQEVGEEPACRHLAGQLVEVKVAVFGQIVHAALLLPDLDGEDGGLAVAHALVCGEEYLAHDAPALRTGVRTIVNG